MKQITKFGMIGLLGLVLISTACKKNPAENLYKTWELSDVNIDTDQVSVEKMIEAGISYSFKKDGSLTFIFAGQTTNGTYTVNETATSITTTVDGKTDTYNLNLSETTMKISKDDGTSMTFASK